MKIQYHSLFEICEDQNALVQEVWDNQEFRLSFRRSLYGDLVGDWESLNQLLEGVHLDQSKEYEVRWVIDKSKNFTTKSLYYAMTHGGVTDKLSKLIWKSKVPLKVRVFCAKYFMISYQPQLL